jgi:RNA polymerase sigma-70 factor (ECF subfamily)
VPTDGLLVHVAAQTEARFIVFDVFESEQAFDRFRAVARPIAIEAGITDARGASNVDERRPRFEASRDQREELATRFFAAVDEGDLDGLEELLAHDVVLHGDGGGKAPALARALHGRARVARALTRGWRHAGTRLGGLTSRRGDINGQPGALLFDREGGLIGVITLHVAEGQIQGVSSIVNPDKLRHLGPVADLRALLRERP